MSDLISRQEVIEVLNERARNMFTLDTGYSFYLGALHDVADDLRQMPTIDAAPGAAEGRMSMGVYIKGFPLPNNCGACPLRLAWCRERIYMVNRPERCPLVPVPPHGLIGEELVRCADCKHYWKNHKDGDSVPVCLASPKDEAFCSEGERRTNE